MFLLDKLIDEIDDKTYHEPAECDTNDGDRRGSQPLPSLLRLGLITVSCHDDKSVIQEITQCYKSKQRQPPIDEVMDVTQRLILCLIGRGDWRRIVDALYSTTGIVHTTSERVTRTNIISLHSFLLILRIDRRSAIKKSKRRHRRERNISDEQREDKCEEFFHGFSCNLPIK